MPIRKIKIEAFSPEVTSIHDFFREQASSEHIAKPTSLEALFQICKANKIKNVLELGGGLGTISRLLLENSEARIDIYEHNPFFAERLRENLSPFSGRYQILTDYRMLPPRREYDLVVVDGGHSRKDSPGEASGFNTSIWFYLNYLESVRFVYIEGNRHIQRLWSKKALARRFVYSVQRFADSEYAGQPISGGLLITCEPSASFIRRIINFFFWEIVEGVTVRNYLLFRLQKIKKLFSK